MAPRVLAHPGTRPTEKGGHCGHHYCTGEAPPKLPLRSGRFGRVRCAASLQPRLRLSASRTTGAERDHATVCRTIPTPLTGGFTKGRPFCFL
jgi:hypothetical protein